MSKKISKQSNLSLSCLRGSNFSNNYSFKDLNDLKSTIKDFANIRKLEACINYLVLLIRRFSTG